MSPSPSIATYSTQTVNLVFQNSPDTRSSEIGCFINLSTTSLENHVTTAQHDAPPSVGKKLRKYPKRRDVGRRATPELVQDASQVPRVGARPGAVRQRSNAAVSMPSLGGSGWWSTPGAERSRDGGYRNLFWYKVGLINGQPGVTTLLIGGENTPLIGEKRPTLCESHWECIQHHAVRSWTNWHNIPQWGEMGSFQLVVEAEGISGQLLLSNHPDG